MSGRASRSDKIYHQEFSGEKLSTDFRTRPDRTDASGDTVQCVGSASC